jgi:pullulanase
MKKESLSALLFAAFVLPLSACGGNPTSNSSESAGTSEPPASSSASSSTASGPSIVFHYYRADAAYDNWALWLWAAPSGAGAEYKHTGVDDYGALFSYSLSTWTADVSAFSLGFIVKSAGSWTAKDPDGDRKLDFSTLTPDSSSNYNVWLKSGESDIYYTEPPKATISKAEFTDFTHVAVATVPDASSYTLYEGETVLKTDTFAAATASWSIELSEAASFEKNYSITVVFANGDSLSKTVDVSSLYDTSAFVNAYTYGEGDLGANYSAASTTFKVWSPVSSAITLRLYNSGTPNSLSPTKGDDTHIDAPMVRGEKGVWSLKIDGDLAGKYYTYIVSNAHYQEAEVVDPYAKGCGINGLRGMIVDFSKTNPEGWTAGAVAYPYDRKALTVYETHVADVTSSSTWGGSASNAKRFLGLAETGTKYTSGNTSVTTGFDHIKELGVNAVQLLPIFDQANDEVNPSFNWGYNPLNYNCLEGVYSSDPYDGYARIKEFKQVVKAYHDAGINIIMDVVYNHVNSVSGLNFDVLMPYYYFRYAVNGTLSNGSGCGNETASNRIMFRNFMKDSSAFWLKEYQLGGFRFDLMALHDLTTMNELVANLKTINPAVTVYGEPWTGGTSALAASEQAKQDNGNSWVGYGAFNDSFRDEMVMSGMKAKTNLGFVTTTATIKLPTADMIALRYGVRGITKTATVTIADPDKTVNYVSCHDNYTLVDRFGITGQTYTSDQLEKMNVLANAVTFTSQGTTFMLAGEEFLRSKGGNGNSYNASYAVNELNYALKVAHPAMFANYKKLIALKQGIDGLHLDAAGVANFMPTYSSDCNEITYTLNDASHSRTYKVVHANGYGTAPAVDFSGYTLELDTLTSGVTLSASTPILPYQTIIAYQAA